MSPSQNAATSYTGPPPRCRLILRREFVVFQWLNPVPLELVTALHALFFLVKCWNFVVVSVRYFQNLEQSQCLFDFFWRPNGGDIITSLTPTQQPFWPRKAQTPAVFSKCSCTFSHRLLQTAAPPSPSHFSERCLLATAPKIQAQKIFRIPTHFPP